MKIKFINLVQAFTLGSLITAYISGYQSSTTCISAMILLILSIVATSLNY